MVLDEKSLGTDPAIISTPVSASSIEATETFSNSEYRKLIWKLDLRLLPPLFALWFISLIDRVNIGAARIQGLEGDLGIDPKGNRFNVATGMFVELLGGMGQEGQGNEKGRGEDREEANFWNSCCVYWSYDCGSTE